MTDIDDTVFPHLATYVAGLPDGLDSHPSCRAKASLHRSALDERPIPPDVSSRLPPDLRELVERPLPVNAWLPETHSHAVMSAIFDVCFLDEDEFGDFAYRQQHRLFSSPLYAVLLKLASPRMLITGGARRWGAFHRGTKLKTIGSSPGAAELLLEHPEGLWDSLSRRGLAAGFRAVLDISGAGNANVEVVEATSTLARFRATWV